MTLERLDFEEAVYRPRDVLLHPLYGHHCRDEHSAVARYADFVAWRWLKAVCGFARIGAVRKPQLVSEAHEVNGTAAGRGTAGDGGA
jgi:hypothetical protein